MRLVSTEIKIDESLALILPQLEQASEVFTRIDADRDHLRTWLPWVDTTLSEDDTRENLFERIEGFRQGTQASFFGTMHGEIVASVGFVSIENTEGEIGYWLLSKFSGRGIMTLFVERCIQYGFDTLGLNTIVIKCAEGNTKSAAIPQRLGFTRVEKIEETRVRNGSEQKTLVFVLNREDWNI